jgi:hypothetical protein
MSTLLTHKLSSVRRKHAAVTGARGLSSLLALAVILLALTMLLDYYLDLSRTLRVALLALNIAALATLFLKYVAAPIAFGPDDDEVALMVERAIPDFRTRLIASVQLSRESDAPHASSQLVRAMVQQTEQLAAPMNFGAVVPTNALGKTAALAALIFLLALAAFLYSADAGKDLLKRAFLSNVPVPRDTRVTTLTEDKTIAIGDPITLRAAADGVIPATGQVRIDYASGRKQTFSIDPTPDDPATFSRTIDNVQESFTYGIKLNDGRSREHAITAVPRPAVTYVELTQEYPPYTKRPNQPRSPGDLSILAGSELVLKLKASKPVTSGAIQLVGLERETPLTITGKNKDELTGTFQVPVKLLTGFSIRLTDAHGITSKPGTVYPIDILPDREPAVRITWPDRKEELATQQAKLLFAFEATDDFGLGKVLVRYLVDRQASPETVAKGEEKAIELDLSKLPTDELRRLRRRYDFDLGATVRPIPPIGSVVEYWLEVHDANNVTGPGKATSDRYRARIVTELEKRTDLMNRLNDQLGTIDYVTQDQEKLNENLGALILEKKD